MPALLRLSGNGLGWELWSCPALSELAAAFPLPAALLLGAVCTWQLCHEVLLAADQKRGLQSTWRESLFSAFLFTVGKGSNLE